MIGRLAVVVCAVAAVVVLAGRLDVARDIARAGELGGSDVEESQRLLRDAASRTSDTTPLVREAQLLLFARRPAAAVAPALRATREEPQNARAWLVLSQAAANTDPALAAEARRRLSELVSSAVSGHRRPRAAGRRGRSPRA